MNEWRFVVPGQPIPKARARIVNGRAYTPEATAGHEEAIAAEAINAGVRCNSTARYSVIVTFFRRGKRHADVDNLLKTVLDALNGIAWRDDNQVWEIHARRLYSTDPRTEIEVKEIME